MKRFYWFIPLTVLVMAVLACGAFGSSGTGGSGGSGSGGSNPGGGNTNYNTKFPLPKSVSNFTDTGNDSINFQTDMSLDDTIQFYRDAFEKQGLTERTINTSISDTTFSMVFDGDPGGKAIVIQGVDMQNGVTNVNIRYEEV